MQTPRQVNPKERLNVGACLMPPDLQNPYRLSGIPKYHCPSCGIVTGFSMDQDTGGESDFEALTHRTMMTTVADAHCRGCGHPFRVVADFEEIHNACFVYDVRCVIEYEENRVD
jgi:hypothetical protein